MVQTLVIDTCLSVGISPYTQFVAEEQLDQWLVDGDIDVQVIFQPDEAFHHETPDWNPYLGNDYIAKTQDLFPGRVLGLGTIQVWHQSPRQFVPEVTRSPAIEEVDRCILDLGLHGLRMNPVQHNYQFNGQWTVWPVLERLSDLQEQVDRRLFVSVHAYGDSLNNSPEAIALTANRFPDLLFLMQHSAFVWGYATVSDVAAPAQNILMDLSTMPQKAVVLQAYQEFGPKKFCIGTDGPVGSFALRDAIVGDFADSEEEREALLGGTLAARLDLMKVDE